MVKVKIGFQKDGGELEFTPTTNNRTESGEKIVNIANGKLKKWKTASKRWEAMQNELYELFYGDE